ncbi:MAG: pyridoxamine 5'-phosphate oxidase family protein [Anaerolineae bacterium]|nr:pyridoxamine 5'-phosphate oxidase family protein [Anaerolineae bacterium]
MPTKQGSVDLLNDPVAQEMLQAPIPMRLAYVWTDGSPRVVPIGFHWTGSEIVAGCPLGAPKLKALAQNPKVALTIDNNKMPYHVLLIRGTASLSTHEGIIPEYVAYCKRYMGEEGAAAWLQQVTPLVPKMVRVAIKPEWVGILDFERRFPSAVERAMGV